MGGFPPPGFGAPGFEATGGGGAGLGFAATGGGGGGFPPASELFGREPAGELPFEPSGVAAFFHGVADPLAAAMPGKTETGLALALAATDCTGFMTLGVGLAAGLGAPGAEGTGRLAGGGGGGGGGAAAGFGFAGMRTR